MNRLNALGLLAGMHEMGNIEIPPCPFPADDGGPPIDIGVEWWVALADVSGCLPDCKNLDDLLDAIGCGARIYQADEVGTEQVEAAVQAVLAEVNRFGRRTDLEGN